MRRRIRYTSDQVLDRRTVTLSRRIGRLENMHEPMTPEEEEKLDGDIVGLLPRVERLEARDREHRAAIIKLQWKTYRLDPKSKYTDPDGFLTPDPPEEKTL